ncbi:Pkinase_Tyr domain-containing protein, partial [Cephalotus follicularis]
WEIDPGKLTVKEEIARGAFASVHKGSYIGQEVAVKIIVWDDDDSQKTKSQADAIKEAFIREVEVWYNLDHPNIAKLIGATLDTTAIRFYNDKDQIVMPTCKPCIVVEYLLGGTLKSYLKNNLGKKLALQIVIQFALDIAKGLSYLHSKNIIHRDMKTDNLLLTKDRRIKITDFGVSRHENPEEIMTGRTGTMGYMAPEVYNKRFYNRKCDVYSFGICLWEIYICSIGKPYPKLTFSQLCNSGESYEKMRPEIPKSCPETLAQVMKKCWNADPNGRPEMKEVVSMLEAINTSRNAGKNIMHHDQPQGCFCFYKSR